MVILYSLIALIIIALDQIVKIWTMNNVSLGETFGKIPFIADLIYVQNTGAAFSILSGKVEILGAVSVAFAVAVIVYWIIKKPKHPLLCTSVMMVFAGAVGNAIDRIRCGFVVDYISLSFMDFPVFNIADIAITVGAVLLVIYTIFFDKGKSENE